MATVFFVVDRGNDNVAYTRDGTFKLSQSDDGLTLVTSDGYIVLSTDGEPIVFDNNIMMDRVSVGRNGVIQYMNDEGQPEDLGFQIELVQFPNRQGLLSAANNLYEVTIASGEAISETDGDIGRTSEIVQGCLEGSNVQIAEEMVNLIVAQRAYEINSKVISTSDDMIGTANNLRR